METNSEKHHDGCLVRGVAGVCGLYAQDCAAVACRLAEQGLVCRGIGAGCGCRRHSSGRHERQGRRRVDCVRLDVRADGRTDVLEAVRRHRHADAAAADEDAEVGRAGRDRLRHGHRIVGIVAARRVRRTEIRHLVRARERLHKRLLFDRAVRHLAESVEMDYEEDEGVVYIKKASWNLGGRSDGANKFKVKLTNDSLLNIEAVEAPLALLLSDVLSQTKLNAMVYGKLDGQVTSHISGIPVREALKYLFRGTAYTFWERDGVYFIGPHEMQTADNSLLIKLKHLRAEDVIKLLPTTLTKSTQIQVVKSQNALMAVGSYDVLDAISQYVDKMDLPVAQILIEVLVVDMDIEKGHNHGLNLLFGKASKNMGSESIFPRIDQTLNAKQTQSVVNGIGLGDVIHVPKDMVTKIDAMEQEKILDVKARSQIATLNGETAVLTIGQTQYYMMSSEVDYNQGDAVTSKTTQRFEQIEANSNITVTPYVTGEGEITCEIVPDFSEPEGSFSSDVPPTLNKRYVKSSVRLRDGETIVLGGMVKESINDVHHQVPFLGSIPILGWLFKNVEQVHSKSQLLIFVTPHIYYGAEGSVDVADEIEKSKQPLVPKKKKGDKKDQKKSEGKK